ncbi:MAG: hypothetical protein M1834_008579 [Cirrosporium novae-zelandiae]|nr:MAG: hypothetical protein M1834_008579 [Cirrosporium novae-zelandiae]
MTLLYFTRFRKPALDRLYSRGISSVSMTTVPRGAWDSHLHVTDPEIFPISSKATYKPHSALLPQAFDNARRLNLPNLVFVQPSTYGIDNACLLDALRKVGPLNGRGVIVIDPKTIKLETLRMYHTLGVRGVRINLKSVSTKMAPKELTDMLRLHAEAIRPLRTWALQLYLDMELLDEIGDFLTDLSMKVVLDHFGTPKELTSDLSKIPGWKAMCKFMEHPEAYVKISAPYRMSKDPQFKDLEAIAKELLSMRNGEGVVFASDWPHTRFEGVDVVPFVERCLEWCADNVQLRERLFRDNAKRLWDVSHSE